MKISAIIRISLAGFLAVATILPAVAEDKPAAADQSSSFKDEKEKASYAVGIMFGNQLKTADFDIDYDVAISTMRDVLAGKEMKLNSQQAREAINAYRMEARKKTAEKNRKEGEEFLAKKKTESGVKTHQVTLPNGKTAELEYKVITEGTGPTPKTNDEVTVNYRGTLINGKEFDSSAKRGQPAKFPLNRVIRGWTEGLQLMKVGSKYEFYIPADLAYGDGGSGPLIQPGSTLIFEVELLSIEPPKPQQTAAPAGNQPLTSDIIRVPSAEELKQGAKIEIIKPEEAAKRAEEEKKKAQQTK